MKGVGANIRFGRGALAVALAVLVAAAGAPRADEAETPLSPPSATARILRSLGLQNPPGKRGDKAYHRKDYEEALRQYGKAVEETTPAAPESPLLDRNIGNALYRQKRYTEAKDYYESALKGFEARAAAKNAEGPERARDSALVSRTHHNLGNLYYRKAEAADSTATQEAIADAREALAHYKKALRLDPGNRATKQNLEMGNAQLQKLLARQERQQKQQQRQQQKQQPEKPPEPSARAKEALARALQFTQEGRYAEAAKVLDAIMRTDRTAVSFGEHRKRLDDVMKILRGENPDAPAGKGAP